MRNQLADGSLRDDLMSNDDLRAQSVEILDCFFDTFIQGREEIIMRQTDEMTDISTPVVQIWDGILVIAELTSNLVKYARAGELLVRAIPNVGIELISADAGPGMVDTARMKTDGVSTGGLAGAGTGSHWATIRPV